MQPLGLTKTFHKVSGHGDCPICTHLRRKDTRRRRPWDYNEAHTGRAREKHRFEREERRAV
jgi:hypothetical protein